MKILKLTAENIKRLVAVEIEPHTNVVRITGKNGQGKSSVLDSIMYALGGGKALPDRPVREGADAGEVKIDLGDIVVTRRFTAAGGTSLYVANKDGARYQSPQAILDALIGRLSFDPLAFVRLKTDEQAALLRELVGLDTSVLDKKRDELYAERTIQNREAKALAARAAAAKCDPAEQADMASIADSLHEANVANEKRAAIENGLTTLRSNLQSANTEIETLENTLRRKREALAALSARIKDGEKLLEATPRIDVSAITAKLRESENQKAAADLYQMYITLNARAETMAKQVDDLTIQIDRIDADKSAMIQAAKMPLPGLSLSGNGVIYNGLPLSQASSAEQLRVSVAIAMALNPKLRVLRITDGSLLDSASMAIVEEMALDNDYQIWIEVVSESGNIGVVIEDGSIVANNHPAETMARYPV